MKTQIAWILGGGSVVALTFITASGMTGCSSNPATDGGNDSGNQPDVINQQDVVQQDVVSTDAGCKTAPSLHPGNPGSLFCGYLDDASVFGGPDGSSTCSGSGSCSCGTGFECCLGGSLGGGQYAPQICSTWGGGCNNPPPDAGVPIECEQTSDCTANGAPTGSICCLTGNPSAPAPDPGPSCPLDLKSSGGSSIGCVVPADAGAAAGTCPNSGDLQVCETQAECPSGKTCTAIRWKLYEIGVCQ